MSASPASSPVNGHASPASDSPVANGAAGHASDSDLSDVEPTYANAASRSASAVPEDDDDDENDEEDDDLAVANDFEDEPSEPSDNDVSDDADFDDVQSDGDADADADADPDLDVAALDQDDDSQASSDSGHAPKRKASAMLAEDDYMRSNPELYGLRRSVSPPQPLPSPPFRLPIVTVPANHRQQSRPAQRRKIVSKLIFCYRLLYVFPTILTL